VYSLWLSKGRTATSNNRDAKDRHLSPSFQFPRAGTCRCVSSNIPWAACCLFFSFVNKDPDLESAPVVPEMGMIELQTFRSVPKGERWWQWPNGCGHKCANAAKERTQRRKHPKQGYSVSENQKRGARCEETTVLMYSVSNPQAIEKMRIKISMNMSK